MLQEDDDQSEDIQTVEGAQDEIPVSLHPNSGKGDTEQVCDLPRRERRAPKIFAYDQLGTPACCNVAYANEMLYQYLPIPYKEVQPMAMWTNPF